MSNIFASSQERIVELWEVDITPLISASPALRWNASDVTTLVWRGFDWMPFPTEGDGFALSQTGKIPEPTFRVGNALGVMSSLLDQAGGLAGARVTRWELWESNLDGRPGADPNAVLSAQQWVASHASRNDAVCEITLNHPLVLENVTFPRRLMLDLLEY